MLTIILGAIGALLDVMILMTLLVGLICLPFLLVVWIIRAIKG